MNSDKSVVIKRRKFLAMLFLIVILGGLLIMMGQHSRSEALFYYFRLEDQVPETHLLRLIDKHISFAFVREKLKESYSDTGRPSIDPELLLRILLIGYLYGITSERKLVEELRMHLAWRWFTGLGFDQEFPHHSTFSKNRHGRFQESNSSKESRIPLEQLAEAAQVNHTVREYLREVEEQNPVEEPVHEQDQVSTTDPDSTYATKGGTPARLGYYDNYLVDNDSCVIVGVQATAARLSQETVAAQDMLTRFTAWQGRTPASGAADTTYGNGEFLQWLLDRNITPYMRTRDSIHRKRSPFFGPERFTYEAEHDRYICPAGQPLNYGGQSDRNAPVRPSVVWSFTSTNRPDNVRGSWSIRRSSRKHSDNGRKWRRCSPNSRIRSDCAACVCGDSSLCASSSSWQRSLRTSSDWCASSVSRQHRFCRPPLNRTDTRKPPPACSQIKKRSVEGLFQHPRDITTDTPGPHPS